MGVGETNVHWGKVTPRHNIWNRVRPWFEHSRVAASYNIRDKFPKRAQQGGVAQITKGKLSHQIIETGRDPRGLGRWTWQRFRGKHDTTTRIISAYRPCLGTGATTVYQQHVRALTADTIHVCPRKQFWDDLSLEIDTWKAAGDQLIIMGDWNQSTLELLNWFRQKGLHNLHQRQHGAKGMPATHQRGSVPIDGVFATSTIIPHQCGFLPFDDGPGDHRGIWFDIPIDTILGFNMSELTSFQARRLKLNNPRLVKKYLQILHKFCLRHNLYNRFVTNMNV